MNTVESPPTDRLRADAGIPTPGRDVALRALGAVAVVLVAVVIPDLIAHHYGAFGIPRSDDWSYLRTAFRWQETGQWDFNGWVSMTLVGQVVLSAPALWWFPGSIAAARVVTGVFGVVGLFATADAARSLGGARGRAFVLILGIALSPLWPALVSTYMSDVPAFALQMVAVACALRALRHTPARTGWLLGAFAAAFGACSIRQYSVVTLGIVTVVGLLTVRRDRGAASGTVRRDRGAASGAVALVPIVAALVAVAASAWIMAWSMGVPGRLGLSMTVPSIQTVRLAFTSLGGFARLTGLLLAPLVLACNPARIAREAFTANRRMTWIATGAAAGLLAVTYVLRPRVPFVGNYVDRRGVLADDIIHGTRPLVMPDALFLVLVVGASLSALVLVWAAVPWLAANLPGGRWRSLVHLADRDPAVALIGWCTAGYVAAYEVAILVDLPIFDRYALGLVPLPGLLLIRRTRSDAPSRTDYARAGGLLAALAVICVAVAAESAAYDAGRWRVAQDAVRAGYAVQDVDAGYEWVGFRLHRAPPYRIKDPAVGRVAKQRYLKGLCTNVVVSDRRPGGTVVAERAVPGLLRPATYLWVVRVPSRTCGSGHP